MFDLGDTLFEPLPSCHIEDNLSKINESVGASLSTRTVLDSFQLARQEGELQYSRYPFYLHRNFIEDVIVSAFESLGVNLSDGLVQTFLELQGMAVINHLQPRDDCMSTLQRLRNLGFKLAIVSNIDDDWFDPLRKSWELDDAVDLCLSSESARSCKPDESIFRQALSSLGIEPGDCIFVGDSLINDVYGSKRVGMQPMWFDKEGKGEDKPAGIASVCRLCEVVNVACGIRT